MKQALIFWVIAGAAGLQAAELPAVKPNIVIILADDQGWGDLSICGNTNLSTPNVDRLARDGARFDRFFVCPLCSPTRAEFLTGRYHSRGGVCGVTMGQERLNTDVKTIGDCFKEAGYATACIGKWHNGSQWPYHPNARGFDEFYGFTSGHWGEYFDPFLEQNGRFVRGRGYIADDLTDHAMAFIEQNRSRPFFCYLAFNTPHSPFCVPDAYWNRFKAKPIAMRGKDGAREDLPVTRCALAMCENIDWNVGRVLEKLASLKLADDTIVVYFSDNGPASWRWNGGMKGRKGSTDEGGVRVPCFIRWPGRIESGLTVRPIAGAIDLLPTLTALAHVRLTPAKPLDGKDLTPLLLGRKGDWPDRMIFSYQGAKLSVRTQQYRLDAGGALFDMTTDPGQKTDVAADRPEVAARLRQAAVTWRKDALPGEKDDRPFPVGYAGIVMTPLPARDALPRGGVQRSAPAPNCSYFRNWTSPADSMIWDIDVQTSGDYAVAVYYTCPMADAGSTIEVSFGKSRLQGQVSPGWDPPLISNQDRVPRKAESYMKEFKPLEMGVIHLNKGRGPLTLRAPRVLGRSVADVRLITLTLKESP